MRSQWSSVKQAVLLALLWFGQGVHPSVATWLPGRSVAFCPPSWRSGRGVGQSHEQAVCWCSTLAHCYVVVLGALPSRLVVGPSIVPRWRLILAVSYVGGVASEAALAAPSDWIALLPLFTDASRRSLHGPFARLRPARLTSLSWPVHPRSAQFISSLCLRLLVECRPLVVIRHGRPSQRVGAMALRVA